MSAEALGAVAAKEKSYPQRTKKKEKNVCISALFVLAVVLCFFFFFLDVSCTIPHSKTSGYRLLICFVPPRDHSATIRSLFGSVAHILVTLYLEIRIRG